MDKRKEILVKTLKDSDENIRKLAAEKLEKLRAVYALGRLKGQKVIQLLLKAIKDPIEDVRAAAIRVLGKMGDPRVMSPLTQCLFYVIENECLMRGFAKGRGLSRAVHCFVFPYL